MSKRFSACVLAVFLIMVWMPWGSLKADEAPVITKQPEDVVVTFPAGATFSVEVEDPDAVESYKWYMMDKESQVFELEGQSAQTDTLIIPSTQGDNDTLDFYCVITDKNGNQVESEHGHLDMDNPRESKPVFYVGEYALEPGDSIDLSAVELPDGEPLGSGVVTYAENGTDIEIANLDYDNSRVMAGLITAPNVGIVMMYDQPEPEYNVTFIGDNRIMNNYYDFDYNMGGIPFDFYIVGENEKPQVNLIGDGNLTIINGTNALRIIGDLMVDIDITVQQTRELYADGLVAQNMMIAPGHKLDLTVYGSALYTSGNLYVKDSEVRIEAHAPHISMGMAAKNVVQGVNSINLEHAVIDIHAATDPEVSPSVGTLSAIYTNGDFMTSDNTQISFDIDVKEGEDLYVSNVMGICCGTGSLDDTAVSIKIDTPQIFNAFGVYADEYFSLVNCDMDVDVHTNGGAYGIAPEGEFGAEESRVNVNVSAYTDYGDIGSYGIMCSSAVFLITDPENKVTSRAEKGMAIGCNLNDINEEKVTYEEGYEAQNFIYRDPGTTIISPEENVVNLGNVQEGEGDDAYYIHVETVYDKNDTTKPAEEVIFGYAEPKEEPESEPEEESSEEPESSKEEASSEEAEPEKEESSKEESSEEQPAPEQGKTAVPQWVWPVALAILIMIIVALVKIIKRKK